MENVEVLASSTLVVARCSAPGRTEQQPDPLALSSASTSSSSSTRLRSSFSAYQYASAAPSAAQLFYSASRRPSSTSSVMANDGELDDDEDDADDFGSYDYEVVFTEEKLGLTLKSHGDGGAGDIGSRTVVKSAHGVAQLSNQIHEGDVLLSVNGVSVEHLHFANVLCVLKVSSRPIRLRFRTTSPRQPLDAFAGQVSSVSAAAGSASRVVVSLDAFLLPEEPQDSDDERNGDSDNDDDADSHHAVHSESFGEADSTRTTENSSVVTDRTEIECKASRHSSRFTAFLRKPFRRADGFDPGRMDLLRLGIVPAAPRLEVAVDSPSKAAVRVFWRGHPKALTYHVQFARDRAMKVWKNWPGRARRSSENRGELVTLLYGLDFAKSYVVRVRFEFDSSYSPGEWSAPSLPVLTPELRVQAASAATAAAAQRTVQQQRLATPSRRT